MSGSKDHPSIPGSSVPSSSFSLLLEALSSRAEPRFCGAVEGPAVRCAGRMIRLRDAAQILRLSVRRSAKKAERENADATLRMTKQSKGRTAKRARKDSLL